jgi:uncharacterized protein
LSERKEKTMTIDISEIVSGANSEAVREVLIGLDAFDSRLGSFPITKKAPFSLTIVNRENSKLIISGSCDITVSIPCDRCLEEVPTDIHLDIDKEFSIEGFKLCGEEMEDNDYLIGLNLDVDKLIYGEILVNWPMKTLCSMDCKGMCRVCGKNLNEGECGCQRTEPDPRMAAFQEIFNKYKEV